MLSQRKVVCLVALIALIGLVGFSGCLGGNKPTSTEPIVGIWVWTSSADNTIYTDTFVGDGTYVTTSSDSSISSKTGTWSKIQTNEYLVKRSDGQTYTWIYHPATDTITQPEYPNVPSYRQGKQPVTTRPVTTRPYTVVTTQAGYEIFNNGNIAAVSNNPTSPTTFIISYPTLITKITNYHWNNAKGASPGTISLKDSSGKLVGTWTATTRSGQGGVPNAYWDVTPGIMIYPDTYTIVDSDSSTWSQNSGSNYKGMTMVYGIMTV